MDYVPRTMDGFSMSHSQLNHHYGATSRPAPDIIDLVSDSSQSDDDCIMLDSPPSPFRPPDRPQDELQDEPQNEIQDKYQDDHEDEPQHELPTATRPRPKPQNNEAQSQVKSEEGEEVKIETLKLQSVLVKPKKRVGRTIQQQFQNPKTWVRCLDEDNPEFTFTVENFYVIWEFCVHREKKEIDRTDLKQSFPRLDIKEREREFEKQVKEVIDWIKALRIKTWEERFTQNVTQMEGFARNALKKGDVETANKIAMRVHKRAERGGFVVPTSSILNDPAVTTPIIPTRNISNDSPSRILRRSKRLAAAGAPLAQISNPNRPLSFGEADHTRTAASNRAQSSNLSRQMDLFEAANCPQPSTLSEKMDSFEAANMIPLASNRVQSFDISRQMDFSEAANKNGITCPVPVQTPILVSAGEYYRNPGIGLGGAGGMSGLEAMSALKVDREASFHGFVEGEVDEDERMEMEMEGQDLPEGIDDHERFYVNC